MKTEVYFFENPATVDPEKPNTISGYAIRYNVLSHILTDPNTGRTYRTVFRPGAFDLNSTIPGMTDIQAYYNHDYDHGYLGRTSNGTLRLEDDGVGIKYSLDLPDTTLGRDVKFLAGNKDIIGASVGIVPDKMGWKKEADGLPIREHNKVGLFELSVVHNPAFPKTSAQLSSIEIGKSLEEFLSKTPNRDRAKRILDLSA